MKIAISSAGTSLDSQVDPRFGRAAYLIIYDNATDEVTQIIDNTESMNVAHGAGINAATTIANAGAQTLITGQVGPKAQAVLDQAGISVFSFAGGTVKQGIEAMGQNVVASEQKMPTLNPVSAGFGQGMGGGMGMRQGMGGGRGKGGCGCRGGMGAGRGN